MNWLEPQRGQATKPGRLRNRRPLPAAAVVAFGLSNGDSAEPVQSVMTSAISLRCTLPGLFAAGLALCLTASVSEGEIVFHPIDGYPPVIGLYGGVLNQDLDLDANGTADVVVQVVGLGIGMSAPGKSEVFCYDDPNPTEIGELVAPLEAGQEVGPALSSQYIPVTNFYSNANSGGGPHWLAGAYRLGADPGEPIVVGKFLLKRAFVGLRFEIDGQLHYGWVDLANVRLGNGATFELYGWAYETEPNTPIEAGAIFNEYPSAQGKAARETLRHLRACRRVVGFKAHDSYALQPRIGFRIDLTQQLSFSGRLTVGDRKYTIAGKLDQDGRFSTHLNRRTGIMLQVQIINGTPQLLGFVQSDSREPIRFGAKAVSGM